MNLIEGIKSAFKSLYINKMRSALTMLGIIIGISSVILMSGIGNGIQKTILSDIQTSTLGNFSVKVDKENEKYKGRDRLRISDAELIARDPRIIGADPETTKYVRYKLNENDVWIYILSSTYDGAKVFPFKFLEGRPFTKKEYSEDRPLITIDHLFAKELFKDESAIGKTLTLKTLDSNNIAKQKTYSIVGVFKNPTGSDNAVGSLFTQKLVFMPLNKLMKFKGDNSLEVITVKVKDSSQMELIMKDVKEKLELSRTKNIYKIKKDDEGKSVGEILDKIQLFVLAVAFISLFVGGIGIMNIMLASVTERIKEIGIRKAIGARNRDILTQFLIESIFLSVVGGVLGVIIGICLGNLVGLLIKIPPVFTLKIIIISVGVSSFIGIAFGVVPARKASLLNPIDALRSD
ncbi:MAG: ABC transporter permease [Psychrilyobacter sp.]|uniref:ABC transporter permease n=1 Tax=Psychrilyobacter sp. TaxID=2586924 RepID=UPI003C77FDD3